MSPEQHRSTHLNRRSCLAVTATAVAGAIGGAGTVGAASNEGYETVTVPADERKVVRVDDGGTFENVLFDVTASGAAVTIVAYGSDWTIRNVAVRGQVDMGDEAVIGAADTDGGTSRIENVWLGDGAVYEEKGGTGIWVSPDHDGHLEIDRVNVQRMCDNGFYCSPPGAGCGGTVALRNCYAANSWVANYRLASGIIEDCVAAVTDDRQYRRGRGVWAWPSGPVVVQGCQFAMNGHHYSFVPGANGEGSDIAVIETQWDDEFHGGWTDHHGGTVYFGGEAGTDPQNVVPEGCPTSAAAAVEE